MQVNLLMTSPWSSQFCPLSVTRQMQVSLLASESPFYKLNQHSPCLPSSYHMVLKFSVTEIVFLVLVVLKDV